MGNLHGIGYGFAAASVIAFTSAPAVACADNLPPTPDPTVMDILDSVLDRSPSTVSPPPPTTPPAQPPAT